MAEAPGLLAKYPLLRETPLADPAQRTQWNVRDADATMIIVDEGGLPVSKGTGLAYALAETSGKPLLIVDLRAADAVERAASWLRTLGAGVTLGIGGPRESEAPGIYRRARDFLDAVLDGLG